MKGLTISAVIFLGFSVLLFPARAAALCVGTTISAAPAAATFAGAAGEYGVFDPAQYMQSVSFQVSSLATLGGCRYYVTLDAGHSGNAAQRRMTRGAETLDYNAFTLAAGNDILAVSGSFNGAGVISGSFPFLLGVNQTNMHTLYWTITPQQIRTADAVRFSDTVNLRVWAELALGIFTNTNSRAITFRARAESDVNLSLVDTGAPLNLGDTAQTVDFGDLLSGQIRSYDTMVRSNDGYRITLESQNGQMLRHQSFPSVMGTVPYSVTFGGAAVSLPAGVPVEAAAVSGTTPLAGTRFATQFTIGSLSGAEPPGNYQDIIIVTVSAH
ncbi:MAG: spore coat protein U domain-containing protein [Alphaproteobacteria bacterium]